MLDQLKFNPPSAALAAAFTVCASGPDCFLVACACGRRFVVTGNACQGAERDELLKHVQHCRKAKKVCNDAGAEDEG